LVGESVFFKKDGARRDTERERKNKLNSEKRFTGKFLTARLDKGQRVEKRGNEQTIRLLRERSRLAAHV